MKFFVYTDVFLSSPNSFASLCCSSKSLLKSILGISSQGGHQSVYKSLLHSRAYNELCYKNVLPKRYETQNIACVLSSLYALRLILSNSHLFYKIFVGPNVFTVPFDFNALPLSDKIDGYIVPSLLIKEYYQSYLRLVKKKKDFFVWPADPIPLYNASNYSRFRNKSHILFYIKNPQYTNKDFIDSIANILKARGVSCSFIKYGCYNPEVYSRLLKQSTHVFFLGVGESQCIAHFEAAASGCKLYALQEGRYHENPLVNLYPYYYADCAPYSSLLDIDVIHDCGSLLKILFSCDFNRCFSKKPFKSSDSFSSLLLSINSSYE
jgi:hypothetical protein